MASGAWTPQRVEKFRSAFFDFLANVYINSKDKGGNYCLGSGLYDAQLRFLNGILDGLAYDVHDFKILKSRQLGCTTIAEALFCFYLGMFPGIQAAVIFDTSAHLKSCRSRILNIIENLPANFRFPGIKTDSREMLLLEGGACVQWIAAGVKETESGGGLGRGSGCNLVLASEVSSWKNEEGIQSLIETFSTEYPNRLYIWESTARGYNHWRDMWQEAKADDLNQRAIFIGWWAKPNQCFERDDPRFERYGLTPPTRDEQAMIATVQREYGHEITPEQLAWHRYKMDPTREAEKGERKGGQFKQQEQPSCVTAETRVGTNKGLIRIDAVTPGMETALGRVLRAGPTGESEIWRVKTAAGYEFRGTPDHPLIDADGNELEIQHSLGKTVLLQPPRFSDETAVVSWRQGVIDGSITITADLARFVGIFMGDGSASGKFRGTQCETSVVCDAKDRDFAAECQRLFLSLFGVPTSSISYDPHGTGGWVAVKTGSRFVHETLHRLGLLRMDITKTMRHVHVPEFIFRSPKHVVAEFLKGLFETDGFVADTGNRVALFSKWPGFLSDVQLLLLQFGITSRQKTMNKKWRGNHYTGKQLELRTQETQRFIQEVGFISQRKRQRCHGDPRRKVRINAQKIIEFRDDVVVAESTGKKEAVYNLTVEGKHWFDASGILTHNTESECFTQAGSSFFDHGALSVQSARVSQFNRPQAYYYQFGSEFPHTTILPSIHWRKTQLRVWDAPQKGVQYVIAADVAFGRNPDNDRSAVQVLACFADCVEQVAEFADATTNTTQFAWVIASLAAWYGTEAESVSVIIEIDGPGEAVWKEWEQLPRLVRSQYMRQVAESRGLTDVFNNVRNYIFSRPDSMGGAGMNWQWKTGNRKEAIMEKLKVYTNDGRAIVKSLDTIDEMRTIARDGASIEAPGGKKDDRVVSYAIGVRAWEDQIRPALITRGRTREAWQNAQKLTTAGRYQVFMENSLQNMFNQNARIAKQAARQARLANIRRR